MAKKIANSIVLNRVFYKTKILDDEDDRKIAELTNKKKKPKTERTFFRSKKRIYLKDIVSIEEYKYSEFNEFTDSELTYVEYGDEFFIAEIDFEILQNILDKYDRNRTLIINN